MMSNPTASATTASTAGLPLLTKQVLDARHPTYRFDFGFLPIPERLRYDPDKPFYFGTLLNVFFGICSTLVCANLYYCQPILIQLSNSFAVTYNEVSRVPTLIQAGYGIGLLSVSLMGDALRRRGLILFLVSSSLCFTVGLAVTDNLYIFEVMSFFIGFTTVSPQVLLALAVDLVPPERRASAISVVSSGFLLGILIARLFSGVVANFVSWRYVYRISIGIQGIVLLGSYLVLPDYPARNRELSYLDTLRSTVKFMVKEPLVVQILLATLPASACYTNFWVTLTFLLGRAPYHYSTISIGLFSLLGILSIVTLPLMGRIIDRIGPWHMGLAATLSCIAFQAVQAAAGGINIAAVIIACFGLDASRQIQNISLATLIFDVSETARSRLNSLLVLAICLGQVMGTSAGTQVFIEYGWRANGLLAMGWLVFPLCILLLRGPHCPRERWIGWQGGLRRKVKLFATELPGRTPGSASDIEKAETTQLSTPESPGKKT